MTSAAAGNERTISLQLREETSVLHRAAERSPFQRQLLAGRLPVRGYLAWLTQMRIIYTALEHHLAEAERLRPVRFETAPWRRTPELERDLQHWSSGADRSEPMPATRAFSDRLAEWAEREPLALLGVLYVLEGSTNGSRHIARILRTAYGLEGSTGLAFLDPYGESQPLRWKAFKIELDRAVPEGAAAAMISAAQATFAALTTIGSELLLSLDHPEPATS